MVEKFLYSKDNLEYRFGRLFTGNIMELSQDSRSGSKSDCRLHVKTSAADSLLCRHRRSPVGKTKAETTANDENIDDENTSTHPRFKNPTPTMSKPFKTCMPVFEGIWSLSSPEPMTSTITLPIPPPDTAKKVVQAINGVSTDINDWIVKPYFPRISKQERKRRERAANVSIPTMGGQEPLQ